MKPTDNDCGKLSETLDLTMAANEKSLLFHPLLDN